MESNILNKIKNQIKWLLNRLQCISLTTGNTDSSNEANGSSIVTEEVNFISAFDEHLEFVDSVLNVPAGKGHTVIKIKDELLERLDTNTFKNVVDSQEIKISWKNGNTKYTKTPLENTTGIKNNIYTRNAFIFDFGNPSGTLPLEIEDVNNLVISMPKWSEISAYSPKLIIDRYKSTKKKGDPAKQNNIYPGIHYSSAGFKLSKTIPLNASLQVIDFDQEAYFKVKGWNGTNYNLITYLVPTGIGKRGANRYVRLVDSVSTQFFNARVYLQFRLQITKDGVVYTSKPLNKIKMICSLNIQSTNLVKSKIKFKFT